ncbi:MAG: FHA domain-containing protein, partial [Actinomycetota bacterium]|nr:FHA domain-containing protein [Actinomycetota bacterium]
MTIGRGAQCDLRICDPDLSRHHLTITSTRGGVIVEDAASTNGTWLDGHALDEPAAWPAGSRLALGSTRLDLVPAWQERLPLHPDGRGRSRFTPRSRHRPVLEEVAFSLPDTSLPQRRPMPPLLSWLLPLVISGLLAWVLRMPMLLLFGLMAPALAIGTYLGDHRVHRRETGEAHEGHTSAVASARTRADRAVQAELARRRARTPDLAHLRAQVVGGPTPEVWSVPLSEAADLRARVGAGPQAAMVHMDDECLSLAEAPLEVGLAGGLGLVGPADLVRALARAVLCQLLVGHGPDRLRLGL